MTKTPSGTEKHHESTEQESTKTPIVFLLSSDGLAQYCINLSRWFTHEAAFYTEQCTTPSLFTTSQSRKALVATHLRTTASNLGSHFLICIMHAHLKIT